MSEDGAFEELRELRQSVTRLEAERDCAALLARYGYYADHGRRDEWIKLFTTDGVVDTMMYFGDDPRNPDPAQLRHTRFVGHDQLHDYINSPGHASLEGLSQHQVGGPPATFRLIDDGTAVMVTYSVVYAKETADITPLVQYQNHSVNRWTFRKVDGQWYIAENIRRRMGSPDTAALVADF